MSLPIDDILLTSYALGELEGAELARVENELATSPEARARVDELRSLAALLSDELGGQAAPGLDDRRRAKIEAAAGGERPRGILLRMDARPWAAAAAILLAFGGALGFGLRGNGDKAQESREIARKETPAPLGREFAKTEPDRDARLDFTATTLADEVRDLKTQLGESRSQTILRVEQQQAPGGTVPQQTGSEPIVGLVTTSGGVAGTPVPGAGSSGGYAPTGAGAPGPVGGGATGPGSPPANAPVAGFVSDKPMDGRANSDAIGLGGGAGGNYKGPPAREEMVRRPRKKADLPGTTLVTADRFAPPEAEQAAANEIHTLERIGDKLDLLETETARLPASKKVAVERLLVEARSRNEELKARTLGLRELSHSEAARPETLERKKAELTEELNELTGRYERVRRYIDDELRRSGNEDYSAVVEQPFKMALNEPLSTIGLDVDTASYANVRRFLNGGAWPPRDAVRVDEMVNYFRYSDLAPEGEENVAVHAEVAACPWNLDNRLLRVAFKAKEIARDARGATSLVFLVDISGSMRSQNKLPLLKEGLKKLSRQLGEDDTVAIVTYASGVRVALEPTFGNDQAKILGVLDSLNAGGSTNGAGGIQTAYEVAAKAFVSGGTNRVILCTDGDFNVGVSDTDQLTRMIEEKAKGGVFLSVLGFGTGNLKDGRMQALANKGDGHYAYIDSDREAEKVLVEELVGTLVTVAKDAKLQVEFNPAEVSSWRLLGYSARILQAQDFNDDKKDAGEIGAGHSVVALYELSPVHGAEADRPAVDPLKYQKKPVVANRGEPGEIATVKLRYKMPEAEKSRLRTLPVVDDGRHYGAASVDFKLSASVALFGQLLSRSGYVGPTSLEAAHELALESIGQDNDPRGLRRELGELIKKAIALRNAMKPQGAER